MSSDLKAAYRPVIRAVASRLSAYGFVQRGSVLRKQAGMNVALIEFQLSDKTTKDRVVFTINLGVFCGALAGGLSGNPTVMDAHLRKRLGFLLPQGEDKWWELTTQTNLAELGDEISAGLAERARPFLDEYLDNKALLALWESGQSPGLTAGKRAEFLAHLKAAT